MRRRTFLIAIFFIIIQKMKSNENHFIKVIYYQGMRSLRCQAFHLFPIVRTVYFLLKIKIMKNMNYNWNLYSVIMYNCIGIDITVLSYLKNIYHGIYAVHIMFSFFFCVGIVISKYLCTCKLEVHYS